MDTPRHLHSRLGHRSVGLGPLLLAMLALCSVEDSPAQDCADPASFCEPREFAAPTRRDRIGRVAAPVWVDDKGPFLFIIDTGASRSTLSPRLVQKLGLTPSITPGVLLSGVTGTAQVPTVRVAQLRVAQLDVPAGELPVIWSDMMANADGILGVAALKDHRVEVDFERNRVRISRSTVSKRRGFMRVPARVVRGGLLVVDVTVGRVQAAAVIDTGAERSLGNLALLRAVQGRRRSEPGHREITVLGATETIAKGRYELAPMVALGEARINRLPLTYGDFHIFQVWDMTDEPALILGMDVLGTLKGFVLDYGARELLLRA